jgi:hypothetical protein
MTEPTTPLRRILDALVTAGIAVVLFAHAQFLILPPHVV